ncbi:MAG: hypothetical protein WCG98_01365 [bacterium]
MLADALAIVAEEAIQLKFAQRLSEYNDKNASDVLPRAIQNAKHYAVRKILVDDLCSYSD